MAERKLKPHFKEGKLPITAWRKERDRLEQEYKIGQAELSPIHAEVKKLWQIKYKVEQVVHEQERQNAVTRQLSLIHIWYPRQFPATGAIPVRTLASP